MRCKWGDLISLEYGRPVKDKAALDGPVPVFGTNGKIGTSHLTPLCPNASFILGRKGAYRGVHYSDVPFSVIDTAFYAKNLAPEKLSLKWAYYMFLTYDINNMDSGSAIPSTDRYEIYAIEVELPTLEEQLKAVHLLETFDDKIELNQKINSNLERQASALLGEYFAKIEILAKLSDIMNFENGFAFQSKSYLSAGQYRIITIKNVQDGKIDSQGAACINTLPTRLKDSCILKTGDVLLSLTGNVGRVGIVCENNLLLNQRVAKIVPFDKNILPFLYFLFRLQSMKVQLEAIAKGTAQLNLSPIEILRLHIPFETESVHQLSIILRPMFLTIIQNSRENIALSDVRDCLLPKLMAGEIDLEEV